MSTSAERNEYKRAVKCQAKAKQLQHTICKLGNIFVNVYKIMCFVQMENMERNILDLVQFTIYIVVLYKLCYGSCFICMHVLENLCACVFVSVCLCVCMCVFDCVHAYVCMRGSLWVCLD